MIHPDAIKEYMNAQRDSFAWVKKLGENKLDKALADLDFSVARKDKPLRKHQKAGALVGIAYPRFGFWYDMGTGKTRLILELIRYFYLRGELKFLLILVPSEDGVWSWEKQIKLWQIGIPYITLGNSPTNEKWQAVNEFEQGLVIATYPGLTWMLSKKEKIKKGPKKGKVRQIPDPKLIRKFAARLDGIVSDESTRLGNKGSLIFRIVEKISSASPFFWALAGRPIGRDPTLIWSQQYLIDHGESLGETLGIFRAGFFTEKRGHFSMFEYKFDEKKRDLLGRFLQHRGLTYASSECQQLPRVTRIREEVNLPEDIEAYYKKAVDALIAAQGNYKLTNSIFLRMRQLSSGFIGMKDDETGERAQFVFPNNPKLDRLLDLIEEMPPDRKFVIFYQFTHSGRTVVQAIEKELKIKCGWLWAGAKDRKTFQDRFESDPKLRGAVVQNQIGSMVLNLQTANYEFFYESPADVINREQAEKRCFRDGQELPGFLYDLVVRGTADQTILNNHVEGENLFQAVMRKPYGI